ncbi:hypothetical protein [Micromonospora schwarzwaldensis]|uniref:hypothetical protein n=1 Tax=Micromonospora sp. DSM 45708 TaxID=3111767 RepID=UPI0031D99AF5
MNPDHLFNVAAAFAQATGNAEHFHARAASATGADRAALTKKASEWQAIAIRRRKHLRASLREEPRGPVVAEPDTELPAALWQRRHVEIRACTDDGSRIRVRCTPAQAVALGTALIGFAALTDQLGGGVLGDILTTFPPRPTTEPQTSNENQEPA